MGAITDLLIWSELKTYQVTMKDSETGELTICYKEDVSEFKLDTKPMGERGAIVIDCILLID
jgi:hypothetical protein